MTPEITIESEKSEIQLAQLDESTINVRILADAGSVNVSFVGIKIKQIEQMGPAGMITIELDET